jgi:hypothetical protein
MELGTCMNYGRFAVQAFGRKAAFLGRARVMKILETIGLSLPCTVSHQNGNHYQKEQPITKT